MKKSYEIPEIVITTFNSLDIMSVSDLEDETNRNNNTGWA